VDFVVSVVSINGEAKVSCALPIDVDFVVLSEDVGQVLDIIFVDVLHTEIVNNKCKADWAPVVTLSVPSFKEACGEEVLCNYSGLWEAVHPAAHLTENVVVCVYFAMESIFKTI
jgi:hypothetical protein